MPAAPTATAWITGRGAVLTRRWEETPCSLRGGRWAARRRCADGVTPATALAAWCPHPCQSLRPARACHGGVRPGAVPRVPRVVGGSLVAGGRPRLTSWPCTLCSGYAPLPRDVFSVRRHMLLHAPPLRLARPPLSRACGLGRRRNAPAARDSWQHPTRRGPCVPTPCGIHGRRAASPQGAWPDSAAGRLSLGDQDLSQYSYEGRWAVAVCLYVLTCAWEEAPPE